MRRLVVILLIALTAVPATALAAKLAAGDGTLTVKDGSGRISVQGKGVIFGHFDKGNLVVVDYNPDDKKDPQVTGAEKTKALSDTTTRYSGKDVRFLFTGGTYRVIVNGIGIDLSAVGKGTVTLLGDSPPADPGQFAVNGGKLQPLPTFVGAGATFTFGTTTTPLPGP